MVHCSNYIASQNCCDAAETNKRVLRVNHLGDTHMKFEKAVKEVQDRLETVTKEVQGRFETVSKEVQGRFETVSKEVQDRVETVGERSQRVAKVSLKHIKAAN